MVLRPWLSALAIGFLSLWSGGPVAHAQGVDVSVSIGDFEDALTPYGEWIQIRGNRVWRPYADVVGGDFVPYQTGGYWVDTDQGWSFETDWDWGWAPFHYGHWFYHPVFAWVWLPGTTWAPSWVDWRSGGGYIGWAPAPPPNFYVAFDSGPRWCFVRTEHFVTRDVYNYVIPRYQYNSIYTVTHGVPDRVRYHNVSWNRGPRRDWIERDVGHPINQARVTPPPPGQVRRIHTPPPPGQPYGPKWAQNPRWNPGPRTTYGTPPGHENRPPSPGHAGFDHVNRPPPPSHERPSFGAPPGHENRPPRPEREHGGFGNRSFQSPPSFGSRPFGPRPGQDARPNFGGDVGPRPNFDTRSDARFNTRPHFNMPSPPSAPRPSPPPQAQPQRQPPPSNGGWKSFGGPAGGGHGGGPPRGVPHGQSSGHHR